MPVRIAIPVPTATDADYNQRSLAPYLEALRAAGAEPIVVPIVESKDRQLELVAAASGVLLPGSRYDVDPVRYGERREPECGEDDPVRTAADELLLEDAFTTRKPVLAICHGAQTLNVWRGGSLVQDLKTAVNHRPGREVVNAHPVEIARGSRLAELKNSPGAAQVNSSHHQAIRALGKGLRVAAVSPADGVIEAVELDSDAHFVVAVQWHPERTCGVSSFSRAIFDGLVRAAGSLSYKVL